MNAVTNEWEELMPPPKGGARHAAKMGTRSNGNGFVSLSMATLAKLDDPKRTLADVSYRFDGERERIRVSFSERGKFKMHVGAKGGGQFTLPPADWLPPNVFRALPVEVESASGNAIILLLPEEWPEPPQAED